MDEMRYIRIGEGYWSVDMGNGQIAPCEAQGEAIDLSTEENDRTLQLLFNRKKGERLHFDDRGQLQKSRWCWLHSRKGVQKAVTRAVDAVLNRAEQIESEREKQVVSHFLYRYMNPEGAIGRMRADVGYRGELKGRICADDRLIPHVDICVGNVYWRVNARSKKVSKALPLNDRIGRVPLVDLSSTDQKVNRAIHRLFERKNRETFFEKEGELHTLAGMRRRWRYWRNRDSERRNVQEVVRQAVGYLDEKLQQVEEHSEELAVLLRAKFQQDGPLAQMKKEHFDRSSIKEKGGIERFLQHNLVEKREALVEALSLLNRFPPIDPPQQLKVDFSKEVERKTLIKVKDSDVRKPIYDSVLTLLDAELPRGYEEMLRGQIPEMADRLTRKVIRYYVIQNKEIPKDITGVAQPLAEGEMDYAFRQWVRHQAKDRLHDLLVAEFFFTKSLGVELESVGDGGSGGARYAFDRTGEKILVVKPGDEGPYGVNNPRWTSWVKQFFLKVRSCLAENIEPVTEVSSYLVDKKYNFDLVPSTSMEFVESATFVGMRKKQCSLQAFVAGCTPMQKRLGFDSGVMKWIWMWNQNVSSLDKIAERFEEGGIFGKKLRGAIPGEKEEAFDRLIASLCESNFMKGDTDCHFDNFLVGEQKVENRTVAKLFSGTRIQKEEIETLVGALFQGKAYQDLHHSLLRSDEGVLLVKHDGGSSIPRRHPTTNWEVRLAYLFEVLPAMKERFSATMKEQLYDCDRLCYEMMAQLALQNLVNVSIASQFKDFWSDQDKRRLFKEWLFGAGENRIDRRGMIALALAGERRGGWRYWHYESHLKRIEGIVDAYRDRWKALVAHLMEAPEEGERSAPFPKESERLKKKAQRDLLSVKKRSDFVELRRGVLAHQVYGDRMRIFDNAVLKWSQHDRLPQEVEIPEDYSDLQRESTITTLVQQLG